VLVLVLDFASMLDWRFMWVIKSGGMLIVNVVMACSAYDRANGANGALMNSALAFVLLSR